MAKLRELATEQRSNAVWWLLSMVVTAVISYYTTHSARFSGVPAYKAIPLGAGVFLILTIGCYLLSLAITTFSKRKAGSSAAEVQAQSGDAEGRQDSANRIQIGLMNIDVTDADTGDEIRGATCTAQHEKTKQEYMGVTDGFGHVGLRVPNGFYLVKVKAPQYGTQVEAIHLAGENAIANVGVDLAKIQEGDASKGLCEESWLHDIAEQDRHNISKSVRIVSCSAENWDLRPEQAHIFFSIVVFNGSVFNIAVDRNIGGHVSYGNDSDGYRRLGGDRMIAGRCRVSECPRYYYLRIEIQQWLTPDDLAALAKGDQSGRFNFQLRDLVINVIGGPGTSGVRPSPLSFHTFESVRFPK